MKANIHLPKLIHLDITLSGVRELKIRVWIATVLIKFAAGLLGGVGKVEIDTKKDQK